MAMEKIAVTLEHELVETLDRLVSEKVYPSRSGAIQAAVREQWRRHQRTRLAQECAKLDPHEEQEWADLGVATDGREWPEY